MQVGDEAYEKAERMLERLLDLDDVDAVCTRFYWTVSADLYPQLAVASTLTVLTCHAGGR